MSAALPPPNALPPQNAFPANRPLDRTFAVLIVNGIWGAVLGIVFVVGVLVLDIAHIRSLAFASPDGFLAIGMLMVGSIITFSSVVMGSAIMRISHEDDDDNPRGGHHARTNGALVPIPVKVGVRHVRR